MVGDPGAVLVIEFRHAHRHQVEKVLGEIEAEFRAASLGYAFPVVWGTDCDRVWELRRAGQGLVNNVVGDAQPREVVEDTAVDVEDLPAYIAEFDELMRAKHGIRCIYYAHAGAGELHTRPLFNLKTPEGLKMFRAIATDVATLVKKYRGSLSGEHGDGRLRGEFIPFMVGPACYAMMRQLKSVFDAPGIFNPGKIIDTPPMDTSLRHSPGHAPEEPATVFSFETTRGVIRATEKCTGVGECRKTHLMGGTMCPSYMVTRDERDTTRARANMLRQVLSRPKTGANRWDSAEVEAVMDLCLSCKGCKAECPSSVDVARLKAEWQQHHHDIHGVPLRSRLIAGFTRLMRVASLAPALYNGIVTTPASARLLKRMIGFAADRSLPTLHTTTLQSWYARHANPASIDYRNGGVYLFCDEFTNFNDTEIGIKAIELLNRLGCRVTIPMHVESGRAQLSKGLVRDAQRLAVRNVEALTDLVTSDTPLIGLEPSALLGFRDEYPDLVPPGLRPAARSLARHALLIDEFIARDADAGRIQPAAFAPRAQTIRLHGHCHQKALASLAPTVRMLELPAGHQVHIVPSGCCGMAGSFGYEAEHFALSQRIGELVLFPAARASAPDEWFVAAGTSCRHQIKDATGRRALHPVEVLHAACCVPAK